MKITLLHIFCSVSFFQVLVKWEERTVFYLCTFQHNIANSDSRQWVLNQYYQFFYPKMSTNVWESFYSSHPLLIRYEVRFLQLLIFIPWILYFLFQQVVNQFHVDIHFLLSLNFICKWEYFLWIPRIINDYDEWGINCHWIK